VGLAAGEGVDAGVAWGRIWESGND
jgi:hypothetical protein